LRFLKLRYFSLTFKNPEKTAGSFGESPRLNDRFSRRLCNSATSKLALRAPIQKRVEVGAFDDARTAKRFNSRAQRRPERVEGRTLGYDPNTSGLR
jgi:hypothetical protein